jgi:hypothetical protein
VFRVIIEPSRRWRWDGDSGAYVEEPGEPGEPLAKDRDAAVAQLIEAMAATVKAVQTSQPPEVSFPPRCPHCGGVPTGARTLAAERSYAGGMFAPQGPRPSGVLALEVPACSRMPSPLGAYFQQIFLAFVTVVATLGILATPYAALVAVAGLAASVVLWRARTWIHLEPVVNDMVVLRVREAAYAHGIARLSRGRVEGGRRLPPVSDADALRAPLPPARAVRGADDD